ncbi:unnamed protein product, partial [Brachionus calyciflorus]
CSLKSEFQKNTEMQKCFRNVCALALSPLDKSEYLFSNILATQPNDQRLEKFMTYFVEKYYEGPTFNCEMWNHYETDGYPRTNNNLEGYNNKLSNQLSVAHPYIFKSISKFKEEETDAALKFYRAINNEKAPQRRKLNIINDTFLNNHRQMLRDEEISIDTYTKYVSMLFELSSLDKKKKKTLNDEEISTASEYNSDESELDEFND